MNNTQKSNRIISYDILRIIATLSIVMIHTAASFVLSSPVGSFEFTVSNFIDSLARVGVPIFAMISGALMLNENKKTSITDMLSHALKIFGLLLFWSLFYAVYYYIAIPIITSKPINIAAAFKAVIDGHYHFWFLYMLIGLYIVTPILRLFVKKENKKYISYMLAIMVAVNFVAPFVNFFTKQYFMGGDSLLHYIEKFELPFSTGCLTYYILGWYLTTFEIKKNRRTLIYVLGVVGFLSTFLCSQLLTTESVEAHGVFYSHNIINVFLHSVAIFVFVIYWSKDKDIKHKNALVKISTTTFGIYIIHDITLRFVDALTLGLENFFLRLMLNYLLTLGISFICMYIISKIPIIKKLIKG